MGDRLKGKVAIVTGGGRGIGRGDAIVLASEGARVVVNDLGGGPDGTGASRSPADDVVAEIKKLGGQAIANYDSVATPKGAEAIIKSAVDAFGRLDILINNAGILRDRMIFNMSDEEWDAVMKVHLYGHYYMTKNACALFRQQRSGRIVNTSSESGLGNMGQANYSAAKEAIVGLTRTVAREMGRYGVTCNAIRPRADTRLTMTDELKKAQERRASAGVGGPGEVNAVEERPPEAIGHLMAWLCTDAAANVNGCTFLVWAGQVSLYSEPVVVKSIDKKGLWTIEELDHIMPRTLAQGLVNPSPAQVLQK